MTKAMSKKAGSSPDDYRSLAEGIKQLLEQARQRAARSVNAILTASYWEIGRRIVEHEQAGQSRAVYGKELLKRLSQDLSGRFGKGFSPDNLEFMRRFYLSWPPAKISETVSRKLESPEGKPKSETASRKLALAELAAALPLSWSHYVSLLRLNKQHARDFYETEALRGGWSVRQLDRQIETQFYERSLLSRDKSKMLTHGAPAHPGDALTPEQELKDPYVLEFLGLKDEYSESELEDALIHHLESFLLELGSDFAFVARQKRLRIGNEWYRADLVFFHRRLRCLVLIDLKLGRFTHADAGQMHLYLNYAREHWTNKDENPPVGLILCAQKDESLAHYALEGLPNKVLASEYKTSLPKEKDLERELQRSQLELLGRQGKPPRKAQ